MPWLIPESALCTTRMKGSAASTVSSPSVTTGTTSSSTRTQRAPQRNYQLSSLVSISNVKSIIASMNSSDRRGLADELKVSSGGDTVNKCTVKSQSSLEKEGVDDGNDDDGTTTLTRRSLDKKHVVRLLEKSRKKSSEAELKSITTDANDDEGGVAVAFNRKRNLSEQNRPVSRRENPLSAVVTTNRRRNPSGLEDEVGANVLECHSAAGNEIARRNMDSDAKIKSDSKKNNHRGQPQSSSDDENDDDKDAVEQMNESISTQDSNEELDSSSSSSSSSSSEGGSSRSSSISSHPDNANGGLEPISEERSLRIDLPDLSSNSRLDGKRGQAKPAAEVEEDVNDGNNLYCTLIDFRKTQWTRFWL